MITQIESRNEDNEVSLTVYQTPSGTIGVEHALDGKTELDLEEARDLRDALNILIPLVEQENAKDH